MRKVLVGLVLLVGIVLTPIFVLSASKPSHFSILRKATDSTVIATVTKLPKGTLVFKEPSKVVIPPGTVSASPTSTLHGTVTPLDTPPTQGNENKYFTETTQDTPDPVSSWEVYNLGSFFGSFTGATKTNVTYTKCLFSISRSYQLKVDMYVTGQNNSTTQYEVFMYDHQANDGFVYSNVLPVGQSVTVTYPNLNPTHQYYLRWSSIANDQSIDGNFSVHY